MKSHGISKFLSSRRKGFNQKTGFYRIWHKNVLPSGIVFFKIWRAKRIILMLYNQKYKFTTVAWLDLIQYWSHLLTAAEICFWSCWRTKVVIKNLLYWWAVLHQWHHVGRCRSANTAWSWEQNHPYLQAVHPTSWLRSSN